MYAHVHCLLMNSAFVGSPTWLMSLEMVSASIYSPQNVSSMILHWWTNEQRYVYSWNNERERFHFHQLCLTDRENTLLLPLQWRWQIVIFTVCIRLTDTTCCSCNLPWEWRVINWQRSLCCFLYSEGDGYHFYTLYLTDRDHFAVSFTVRVTDCHFYTLYLTDRDHSAVSFTVRVTDIIFTHCIWLTEITLLFPLQWGWQISFLHTVSDWQRSLCCFLYSEGDRYHLYTLYLTDRDHSAVSFTVRVTDHHFYWLYLKEITLCCFLYSEGDRYHFYWLYLTDRDHFAVAFTVRVTDHHFYWLYLKEITLCCFLYSEGDRLSFLLIVSDWQRSHFAVIFTDCIWLTEITLCCCLYSDSYVSIMFGSHLQRFPCICCSEHFTLRVKGSVLIRPTLELFPRWSVAYGLSWALGQSCSELHWLAVVIICCCLSLQQRRRCDKTQASGWWRHLTRRKPAPLISFWQWLPSLWKKWGQPSLSRQDSDVLLASLITRLVRLPRASQFFFLPIKDWALSECCQSCRTWFEAWLVRF